MISHINDGPNKPIHPESPVKPEHPAHPEPPVKPEHPAHPPKPEHPNRITILVNGEEKMLAPHTTAVSYEEIVKMAYGALQNNSSTIYTVAYSNGPISNPKGTLVRGRSVQIREGMVFNVSKSDKS